MPPPKDKIKREEWIEKLRVSGLGRRHSREELKKMSLSQLGTKNHMYGKHKTNEEKKAISEKLKGRTITESHREKIRKARLVTNGMRGVFGEKHPSWRGGKTKESFKIRNSNEYKLWRRAVFQRDGYKCIWCGVAGAILEADHIKPFSLFPELRFAIDNGRTLCKSCHSKTSTYKNPKGFNQYKP